MELSSQISELHSTYEALSVILSSICKKVSEITEYNGMLGTETYNKLLQWQTDLNNQLIQVKTEIESYYAKIDQVRQALMGSTEQVGDKPVASETKEESKMSKDDMKMKVKDMMDKEMPEDDIIEMMKKEGMSSSEIKDMLKVCKDEYEEDAARSKNPDDYLVVERRDDPSTFHLQVKRNGKPDHNLMGAAWAALHSGFRGNKYQGKGKAEAIKKLKALYKKEKMELPSE